MSKYKFTLLALLLSNHGLSATNKTWKSKKLEVQSRSLSDLTGLVFPPNWQNSGSWENIQEVENIPAHFNWNDLYQLQPIRKQKCSDCWAQATTNVVESLYYMNYPLSRNEIHGSVQAVIDCSGEGSCSGGYFGAMAYFKNEGSPYESKYPYKARTQRCPGKFSEPLLKISKWGYVGEKGKSPTTEQIKASVYKYGPVTVDIYANSALSSYGSGVFTACSNKTTNHMVVIEGWQDDPKFKDFGGGYWIVRNSWGPDWGEQGFFRIVYKSKSGSKCSNVASTAVFASLDSESDKFKSRAEEGGLKKEEMGFFSRIFSVFSKIFSF
jgi:C1A family cysteine protease